jgi:hypothetical protein
MSVSTLEQHSTRARPSVALKRVVWWSVLGSTVEWYDFLVYNDPLGMRTRRTNWRDQRSGGGCPDQTGAPQDRTPSSDRRA